MNAKSRETLMGAIGDEYTSIVKIKNIFEKVELVLDHTYFDYKLLKCAVARGNPKIVELLLSLGCRLRNPGYLNQEEGLLHVAMRASNTGILQQLLECGAAIFDKNERGETAIHAAFNEGFYNAAYVMLNFTCSPNFVRLSARRLHPVNQDDVCHFHIACILNNLNVVERYLKLGFDVNAPLYLSFDGVRSAPRSHNLLHYAIGRNNSCLFDLLLYNNGDLTMKDARGLTPLLAMYHADLCDSAMFKNALIYGNDTKYVNSADAHGVTHFHLCCTLNYPDLIEAFIRRGADVNGVVSLESPRDAGFTPLHFAVRSGCARVASLLLSSGADCDRADAEGRTPLHLLFYVAEDLRDGLVDEFIAKVGRAANLTDSHGLSYFHMLCTRADAPLVEYCLAAGVPVNERVLSGLYAGYSALHFAVLCSQREVVEVLLQWKADVDAKSAQFLLTPLHLACKFYKRCRAAELSCEYDPRFVDYSTRCEAELEIIQLLIAHQANVDARDCLGRSPLMQLCAIDKIVYSHKDCTDCSALLIKSPYIHSKEFLKLRKGTCKLRDELLTEFRAVQKEIIEILLINDADINARNCRRETVLHVVTKSSYVNNLGAELAEYLLWEGADVYAVDKDRLTALHLAVQFTNTALVTLFVDHDADTNAKSADFTTPLEIAVENVQKCPSNVTREMIHFLLNNRANANVRNKNCRTLLQDAVEKRNSFLVNKLLEKGADINMISDNVFKLVKRINRMPKLLKPTDALFPIIEDIFTHSQKLLALGVPVKSKLQENSIKLLYYLENVKAMLEQLNVPSGAIKIDFEKLEHVFTDCLQELQRLRRVKVNNYLNMYQVLLKDVHTLSRYVRNKKFIGILESGKFPLYDYMLRFKLNRALTRRKQLDFARTSLSILSHTRYPFPDPCCDMVLKYLSMQDIVNLKIAVTMSQKDSDDANTSKSSSGSEEKDKTD